MKKTKFSCYRPADFLWVFVLLGLINSSDSKMSVTDSNSVNLNIISAGTGLVA